MEKYYKYELSIKANVMESTEEYKVSNPNGCALYIKEMTDINYATEENLVAIVLDNKHKIIGHKTISIGTIDASFTHPREIFKFALAVNAKAIILTHNHPSGDATPSIEDINTSKRIIKAGELLGVEMLDHIVVAHENHISLKEKGLI